MLIIVGYRLLIIIIVIKYFMKSFFGAFLEFVCARDNWILGANLWLCFVFEEKNRFIIPIFAHKSVNTNLPPQNNDPLPAPKQDMATKIGITQATFGMTSSAQVCKKIISLFREEKI